MTKNTPANTSLVETGRKATTFMKAKKPPTKPKSKTPAAPAVNFADDAAENRQPTSDELVQVSALAGRLVQINSAKERLLEQITKLDEEFDRIQSADLPSLMDSIGLKTFTLQSGEHIIVKPIIKGALPSESAILKEQDPVKRAELRERFELGLKFLEQHGAGALVKNVLSAELGKDSSDLAQEAAAALKSLGIEPTLARGVNPNSLNAWIKERIANGDDVDYDLFKIYSGNRAEVKTSKRK